MQDYLEVCGGGGGVFCFTSICLYVHYVLVTLKGSSFGLGFYGPVNPLVSHRAIQTG